MNFHLNRWRYSHVTSFLANHAAMFLGPWSCGSECCSSNSNAPDISQKGLIGIQSHHSREKMSKKAREKPAEAGSASVSPYGSVLGYELVTSQPNRLINLIWPECRTWFIGPWSGPRVRPWSPSLSINNASRENLCNGLWAPPPSATTQITNIFSLISGGEPGEQQTVRSACDVVIGGGTGGTVPPLNARF